MSGDFTQVCTPSGGGSGINLDALPPLPDPDALDAHVQSMIAAGVRFHEGVQDAARHWARLREFYRTPDAEQVLGAFNPALAKSARVRDLTGAAARALYAYSDRARDLQHRITRLRSEVQALDAVILANDDWHSTNQIVDTHQHLMSTASGLAQAILDSDAHCANELSALTHGPRYTTAHIPSSSDHATTDLLSNGFRALQHYLGTDIPSPAMPWGPGVSIRHEGPLSGLQGFGTAAVGAAQSLYTLFGTSDKDQQSAAWQGMGVLGVAVFRAKAVIDRGFTDMDTGDIDALLTAAAAIKETVHADEWGTDPWRAGGQTAFDLASAAAGGGVGGGLSVEARITALTARLRSLPTKTTTVAEAGAAVASAAAKAGARAQELEDVTARVESHLAATGKTIDDYKLPPPATESPNPAKEPTRASGQPANLSSENPAPEADPTPQAQPKGLWSDDIEAMAKKTTLAPETGPKTSGIDEARLKRRLAGITADPIDVPGEATLGDAHVQHHGTPSEPPAGAPAASTDAPSNAEHTPVADNAEPGPTPHPDDPPSPRDQLRDKPLARHGEHAPYPEATDLNERTLETVSDPDAPWGRFENGHGKPMTKSEYDTRHTLLTEEGETWDIYPPNAGAVRGTRQDFTSMKGFVDEYGNKLDRIGSEQGEYLGVMEDGKPASFEERSLPVNSLGKKYFEYRWAEDWPPGTEGWTIEASRIAPGFGRKGGGLQVVVRDASGRGQKVEQLIKAGVLHKCV